MLALNESQALARISRPQRSSINWGTMLPVFLALATHAAASDLTPFQERLKALPFKIAYECYSNDNWEIFTMNPDGSSAMNLTQTPDQHEHYPQVSPDSSKICFSVDQGEGRQAVRSLNVMDIDGRQRKK